MKRWYNPARTLIFLAPIVMMSSDDNGGCSTSTPKALSESQVSQALVGNTLEKSGEKVFALLRADGTAAVKLPDGKSDQGNWRVDKDGQLCVLWTTRDGKENCGGVKSAGKDGYKWHDVQFKVHEGNIKNL